MFSPTIHFKTGAQTQKTFVSTLVFVFILSLILSWKHFGQTNNRSSIHAWTHPSQEVIRNATLGFQEIFALVLPDRGDRRQPLIEAANATNISIAVIDAIRDQDVKLDGSPWSEEWHEGWKWNKGEGDLGCLVSHTQSWQKVVSERISSALILESDADWDVRITDIMSPMGEAVTRIADWPNAKHDPAEPPSPYGNDWDLIWLGHCGAHPSGRRFYEINDTATPPMDHQWTFGDVPGDDVHRPGTRIAYAMDYAMCAYAYAISYKGAVKMLDYVKETDTSFDLAMSNICQWHGDMNCVGVWPQVFTASGSASNIERPEEDLVPAAENPDEIVPGPTLQYSARVNAKAILRGLGRDRWHPEWNSTWAMVNDTWSLVAFDEEKVAGR